MRPLYFAPFSINYNRIKKFKIVNKLNIFAYKNLINNSFKMNAGSDNNMRQRNPPAMMGHSASS